MRQGDKVFMHSASGLDFEVPTLNSIRLEKKWHLPKNAISAMIMAKSHLEKLGVCITCHQHIPVGSFTGVHKKSFHDQLMDRTWAPRLTFHSIFETKKPQVPWENKVSQFKEFPTYLVDFP